jgi:hypothetical protein
MWVISGLAEDLLASQGGLCPMEYVSKYIAFISEVGDSMFLQNVNKFVHVHGVPHPRTWFYGKQVCYAIINSM